MSSTEGSETDDERDYHDFLFSKAQKKAAAVDYITAEKILRQLFKKGGSYLQPGTDRHYNTTSLMIEALKGQGKLTEALELYGTSISEIENLLGPDNLLCSMLKDEREELKQAIQQENKDRNEDQFGPTETEPEAVVSQTESSTVEPKSRIESSVLPQHDIWISETEASGGASRPYYETMVLEPPPPTVQVETEVMPPPVLKIETEAVTLSTTKAMPMETVAIEPDRGPIEPKSITSPPLIERRLGEPIVDSLERITLTDRDTYSEFPEVVADTGKEVLPAVEEEKEVVDFSMLSPTQANAPKEKRVSRSTSVFRAKDDEKAAVKMNPFDLSSFQGLVWPPWDENNAVNILLVGESGCGKTMLRRRLLRTFLPNDEYTPTPPERSIHAGRLFDGDECPSVKIMEVSDLAEYLSEVQTSGSTSPRLDSEQMLRRMAITNTDLYIMCFSVGDMRALHNIEMKWYPQLRRLAQSRLTQDDTGKPLKNLMIIACESAENRDGPQVMEKYMPTMTARYLNAQYFEVSAESWDDSITDLSKAIAQVIPKPPANIDSRPSYKILFVGDFNCGVTYLSRGLHGVPWKPVHYNSTENIYDLYPLNYRSSNGEYYRLDLWDTLGVDDYDRVRVHTYPGTHIICYCFSIASPDSWDNVYERWYPMISHYLPKVPSLLIGTQKDRSTNEKYLTELARYSQKPVTWDQGDELRARIGAVKYIETSLVTGEGLFDVKETLVDVIKMFPPPKDSSIRKSISVRNIFKRK